MKSHWLAGEWLKLLNLVFFSHVFPVVSNQDSCPANDDKPGKDHKPERGAGDFSSDGTNFGMNWRNETNSLVLNIEDSVIVSDEVIA